MKKIVVLTGAGISAESGLKTFRDHGGLWEGHDVQTVATPEGWARDPELVLRFYNERRKAGVDAKPNEAHLALVNLEEKFEVTIVTQNVDDLHEKAGSSKIIHLHGEISKARSTIDPNLIYPVKGWQLNIGDRCEKGSQLRPHIVWFGEEVPLMEEAINVSREADIFLVIGTSMIVYPAASIIDFVPVRSQKFLVDPKIPSLSMISNLRSFAKKATEGVPELVEAILNTM